MAITEDGKAPYAPPAAVIEVIRRYRERGLQTPFTQEVLMKAGITESLAPRTLQALRLLDLIDKDGAPSTEFEAIRKASEADYKELLGNVIQAAYAEVFQFADPATDPVNDAFRSYKPVGQRERMVTLFLGLCQEAGIVTASAAKPRDSAKPSGTGRKRGLAGPKKGIPERHSKESVTPAKGLLFGVTDDDIASLSEEDFKEVWDALGKVARARSRPKQPEKAPSNDGRVDTQSNE